MYAVGRINVFLLTAHHLELGCRCKSYVAIKFPPSMVPVLMQLNVLSSTTTLSLTSDENAAHIHLDSGGTESSR